MKFKNPALLAVGIVLFAALMVARDYASDRTVRWILAGVGFAILISAIKAFGRRSTVKAP